MLLGATPISTSYLSYSSVYMLITAKKFQIRVHHLLFPPSLLPTWIDDRKRCCAMIFHRFCSILSFLVWDLFEIYGNILHFAFFLLFFVVPWRYWASWTSVHEIFTLYSRFFNIIYRASFFILTNIEETLHDYKDILCFIKKGLKNSWYFYLQSHFSWTFTTLFCLLIISSLFFFFCLHGNGFFIFLFSEYGVDEMAKWWRLMAAKLPSQNEAIFFLFLLSFML